MATYARGIHSVGQCGICGLPFPYTDLRPDGETRGLMVCQECWDPKHPQETPAKPIDPIALRRPSPMSVKNPGSTMSYPFYDVNTGLTFGANMARFAIGMPSPEFTKTPSFDSTFISFDSTLFTWDQTD